MNNYIFIQARMSSKRFPGKVLAKINGIPLIEFVYRRSNIISVFKPVVITSEERSDDELAMFLKSKNIPFFRGELNNVLKRFYDAANYFNAHNICRVCADSPFFDVYNTERMLDILMKNNLDYIMPVNLLNGFISELFTFETLKKLITMRLAKDMLEHVTLYIRQNKDKFLTEFLNVNLKPSKLKDITLTIDYPEDLRFAEKVSSGLRLFDFTSENVIQTLYNLKEDCSET